MVLSEGFNIDQGKPSIPTLHHAGINLMTRYTSLAHHFAIYIVLSEFEPYFYQTYLPSFLFRIFSPQLLLASITWYFNSFLLWFMYFPFESASHILSVIEPAHSVEVFRIWLIVFRLRLRAHPLTLSTLWIHLKWIWQRLDLRSTWSVKVAKIFLLSSSSFRSFYTSLLVLRAARSLSKSVVRTSYGIYSSVLLVIMVAARGRAHLAFILSMLLCMYMNAVIEKYTIDLFKRAREVASRDHYVSHVLNCWTGSRRPTTQDIEDFKLRVWVASCKESSRRSEAEDILIEIVGSVLVGLPLRTLAQFWNDRTGEASAPDYSSHDDLIIQKHTAAEAFGVVGLATLIEKLFDGTLSLDGLGWSFWSNVCMILSSDRPQLGFKRKAQWTSRVSLVSLTESRLKNLSLGIRCIGSRSNWYDGFVNRMAKNYSPVHERVEAAADVFLGFKYGVAISYRHERILFESCALLESLLRNPAPCIPLNRVSINSRVPEDIEVVWADVFVKKIKEVEAIQSPWAYYGLEPYIYFDVLRQRRIVDAEKRLWLALECRLPRCSFPRHHLAQLSVFTALYTSGKYLFLKAFCREDVVEISRIGRQLYLQDGADHIGLDLFLVDEDIHGGDVSVHETGSRSIIHLSSEEIEEAKETAVELIERGIYRRYNGALSATHRRYFANEPAFIYFGEAEEESQIVVLGRLTTVEYRRWREGNAVLNESLLDEPRFLLTSRADPR